jgi:hypothetical protein
MLVAEDHPAEKNGVPPPLKSDGPLSEKDEQAQAVERARSLQKEALEKWNRFKEKIGKFIHPQKRRGNK